MNERERAEQLAGLMLTLIGDGNALVTAEMARLFEKYRPDIKINYIGENDELKPGINALYEH